MFFFLGGGGLFYFIYYYYLKNKKLWYFFLFFLSVCGIFYPVCGTVLIKEPLLLIEKSSPYSGGSRFPLTISFGPLPYV